jgi:hypothetical protein
MRERELFTHCRKTRRADTIKNLLELIQILCARGESLDDIWATAEQAIQQLDSRH